MVQPEMSWRNRVLEALALAIAVAVVAWVVWTLLGPLLPALLVLIAVGGLLFGVLRGPHARS
jgi:hypothetical protein